MAVERVLPDVERTRRAAGWGLVVLGLGPLLATAWAVGTFARLNVPTAIVMALPAAVVTWGLSLALRRRVVLEVDLANRTYAVIRTGVRSASGPLDELGPLTVSLRTRRVRTKNGHTTVTEYVVNPSAHPLIDLFARSSPGQARQKMEALARRFKLPCRSLGGELRAASDLDKPLHERHRGQPPRAAAPLRPEWGLRIDALMPGYTLVSTYRSWAPLAHGALAVLPTVLVLGIAFGSGLPATLRDAGGDLLERVLAGLLGGVVLVGLVQLGKGALNTFHPGAVRVTERGVSYRGRTLAFDQIEEITATSPIEVVGDRRILTLPVSFCPLEATTVVAQELQRLSLEVASQSATKHR